MDSAGHGDHEEKAFMENGEKQIYQNIIASLSDGVLVIGYDSRINICNGAASDILGLEQDAAIGKSLALLMTEIDGNDEFFELLLDAVYEKKKISKTVTFRTPGALKYLKVTTTFLIEDDKNTALIVVISDQTEVNELIIKNRSLATQITALMNSFVEVMVTAVEEKSPYNANHTRNMVRYATNYLDWFVLQDKPESGLTYNTVPLLMSIWLHDIGKLLIPPEVLDKPTRLGPSIVNVMHKIEISRLMHKVLVLSGEDTEEHAGTELKKLDEAESLIKSSNTASFLDDDTIARLREFAAVECLMPDGSTCPLLDPGELTKITVVRGTLTADERKIIESHVTLTGKLLNKMEFVGNYRHVPEWASSHHEYLDGTGYPNRLKGDEIPPETRLLTVLDIFDALTAEDRPYKPPMPPEKAMGILKDMANEGKLDKEIVDSFYASNAWKMSREKKHMKELKIKAATENLNEALSFIDDYLDEAGCSMKNKMQTDLAVEEIFVNVALYAYVPETGDVTIRLELDDEKTKFYITFIDSGIPYDPLAKEDPDITLSSEERPIGGLGIFLIKKYMDDIRYKFEDGCNKLTIIKSLK